MGIKATLIPGDGIGPEIVTATQTVLRHMGDPFEFDIQTAGHAAFEKYGTAFPDATRDSIQERGLALKGPLATPSGGGYRSATVQMREAFQLFANVRPSHSFVPGYRNDVDLVLVRENLQGLYGSVEGFIPSFADPHAVAFATSYNTKEEMRRILRYAFGLAVQRDGMRKVTVVHKANILKMLSGILVEAAHEIERDYGDVTVELEIADAFGANLVRKPHTYDVIVTTNLFGDLFSDIAAVLVGSLGTAAGANYGENVAIFEAVHGTAEDIVGKGIANPTSILLSTAMMLQHVGLHHESTILERAVKDAIMAGEMTGDIGGKLDTNGFVKAVCERL
ncbi:isocitrate/isopropylmalate dehydrogenase family protein [Agrobacterium rubi]|nr:isocitrate/isopropylmalate dehydrogenase family protein [Agrobacterium rubi]NTF23708.1 isocitrate/isopropylmalate dehydrogenase family protein [Agrobacterium rubi]